MMDTEQVHARLEGYGLVTRSHIENNPSVEEDLNG